MTVNSVKIFKYQILNLSNRKILSMRINMGRHPVLESIKMEKLFFNEKKYHTW